MEFAGFEMPLDYGSILAEHRAVRQAAGLFDVSHMGRFLVRGDGARPLLEWTTTNSVAALEPGQAQYTLMTNPQGGIKDDLILYRLGAEEYLAVVNAVNREKDWAWLQAHRSPQTEMVDWSQERCLLAWQGPQAQAILQPLVGLNLGRLPAFHWAEGAVSGLPLLLLRTGYTGEDGFELLCRAEHAAPLWTALLGAGKEQGARPAGLGARDTLRLEAGFRLYGHELSEEINPLEAGLERVVKLDKPGGFVGRERLQEAKERGVEHRLVGLVMEEAGIPRPGCAILLEGRAIGEVTSGGPSPTLERAIALGYVSREQAQPGLSVEVLIRQRPRRARLHRPRFYDRRRT